MPRNKSQSIFDIFLCISGSGASAGYALDITSATTVSGLGTVICATSYFGIAQVTCLEDGGNFTYSGCEPCATGTIAGAEGATTCSLCSLCGEVANSSQRWLMERTGTTWPFSHRPRQPAETVGPGITGVVVS